MLRALLMTGIQEGHLDLSGKNEEQAEQEISSYVRKAIRNKSHAWSADHSSFLLSEARRAMRLNRSEVAALFLATWFEHWVNWTIRCLAIRQKISGEQIADIIRSVSIRGKFGWLLELLGAPPISKKHQNLIKRICESRNAFVHYKWTMTPLDEPLVAQKNLKADLLTIEKTIGYLNRYSSRNLKQGSGNVVRRLVTRRISRPSPR